MNEEDIKVTCLLATHYYNAMTNRAIQSILDQTFKDFELIILVNGDEKILHQIQNDFSDSRIRYVFSNIQQLAHNLNLGLNDAKGEYIARMDSDDIALPQRFEKQLQILNEDKSIIVVSTEALYIDANDNEIQTPKIFHTSDRDKLNDSFWLTNPIIHPSVMFRKREILLCKGYADYVNEDYSLWLRLLRTNPRPFFIINEPLIKYRIHANQSRGKLESYATSCSYLIREFLITRKFKYFIGFLLAVLKAFVKSK